MAPRLSLVKPLTQHLQSRRYKAINLIILPPAASNSATDVSTFPKKTFLFKNNNHFQPNPELNFPSLPFGCCRQFNRKISSNGQSIGVADGSAAEFSQDLSISDFIRFKRGSATDRDDNGGGGGTALQTAVVSYRKQFDKNSDNLKKSQKKGYRKQFPSSILQSSVRVDLVSTIHAADTEYFVTLEKELETYDCVLYELVVSSKSLENRNPGANRRLKGSLPIKFSTDESFDSARQLFQILMLDFQLDSLNYQAKNWYHADLDYETYHLLQLQKGESSSTNKENVYTKVTVQPTSIPEVGSKVADPENFVSWLKENYPDLKEALFRLGFGAVIKVFMAKKLTSGLQETTEVEAKSFGIGERNKAAAEALKKAVDGGHKTIAILYGAGHMPDLGRRLREEFGLIPTEARWMTAWSIKKYGLFPLLEKTAEVLEWPLNRHQTFALLIFPLALAVYLWF